MRIQPEAKPFTSEQMKQVFDTSIIDFALSNGLKLEKGDSATMHVKGLPDGCGGLYLFNHGRGYFWFSKDTKGNIIEFAMDYFGLRSEEEAVEKILGCRAYDHSEAYAMMDFTPSEKPPKGEMILPPKAPNFNRAIAYLTQTRGIDKEIVYALINQKKIFQSKENKVDKKTGELKTYQNCCFVGYDEAGKPRYCAMRSMYSDSSFKQDRENSDKTYGFTMVGTSRRIYEFEAPIDAISHATLCKLHGIDWRLDHRVAEGCLSDRALRRYLGLHPEIKEIVFCYDNDVDGKEPDGTPHNHGQIRAEQASREFAGLGYKTMIQTPAYKDFNLDLRSFRKAAVQPILPNQEADIGMEH
jgi:hypothetical protein